MLTNDQIFLAVFPFEDLSMQKDLGIFCRSFSADLVTELSRFRQFGIISFPGHFSATDPSSVKSFDKLQTDYFILGTFRYERENVRINVQLYNSNSGHLVWGNRLEGKLTELNEMQDNLLNGIVGVLQQQINYDLLSRIRKRSKIEFRAYEHWLYGMDALKQASVENDLVARAHFQKALEIQPDYSLAHTGMSLTYFNEWTCQLWERWDVSKTGAYKWAQKAIELDDQNYIAAMVIGKILLYEGAYDTAEYYLRKSLSLNPNDPDTLMQIAFCFVFLGFNNEGVKLYERVIRSNPLNIGNYYAYGAFIYLELGEYQKAASLAMQSQNVKFASGDSYYAAIYYHLQQYEKMQTHWDLFLDTYRRLISKGEEFAPQDAIDWVLKLNPHRYGTSLEPFLQYISNGSFAKYPVQDHYAVNDKERKKNNAINNCFLKDTIAWRLTYDGSAIQVPELKGFYDIRKLLTQPGQVFHCAELMGSGVDGKGEKLIDEKARRQYQEKILELQTDIQEAEQQSDFMRLEKLQEEYDRLIEYLSQSLGLKGKARETGGTVEKARSAITWRIRNAIARIEQHHPMLGAHLSNAIKTGTLCSYQPDREIAWVTS